MSIFSRKSELEAAEAAAMKARRRADEARGRLVEIDLERARIEGERIDPDAEIADAERFAVERASRLGTVSARMDAIDGMAIEAEKALIDAKLEVMSLETKRAADAAAYYRSEMNKAADEIAKQVLPGLVNLARLSWLANASHEISLRNTPDHAIGVSRPSLEGIAALFLDRLSTPHGAPTPGPFDAALKCAPRRDEPNVLTLSPALTPEDRSAISGAGVIADFRRVLTKALHTRTDEPAKESPAVVNARVVQCEREVERLQGIVTRLEGGNEFNINGEVVRVETLPRWKAALKAALQKLERVRSQSETEV